ncbi:alpha/beta hydrolase [Streptomyces sp. HSW2009]|uniref:alpha/beta hydrolase n=1 Tax=Streptomyces sp. HSW2009 TaxID=3142890 RepID=UPI0032EC67C9
MSRHHTSTAGAAAPIRARRRTTVTAAAVLLAVCATPALAAPDPAPQRAADTPAATGTAADHAGRGTLHAITPLPRLSRDEVSRTLKDAGVDVSAVRHGVASYRLDYATRTPTGRPTTASALLVLPEGGGHRLTTVAEMHGTTVYREDAPSTGDNATDLGALLYGSGGRAVVAPDYLGLGTGPGTHPYMDTASSVTASIDALRAARTATARLGRTLTGDVHVTGFSQGGQVAMAVGKELARGADRHFRLRSLTPVSGPYDIGGQELPAIFDGRVDQVSAVFYLSYFLTAQNKLHHLYGDPREVFRQPYADRVEELLNNDHTEKEVARGLAPTVQELLTDEWIERLKHPTGKLAEVVARNDTTCDWRPRVPVRLHTAAGDRDVPIGNTTSCVAALAEHGARAEVIDHGQVPHFGAYRAAIADNARWLARRG